MEKLLFCKWVWAGCPKLGHATLHRSQSCTLNVTVHGQGKVKIGRIPLSSRCVSNTLSTLPHENITKRKKTFRQLEIFYYILYTTRPDKHGRVFLVPCKKWLIQCTLQCTRTLYKSLFTNTRKVLEKQSHV